MLVEFTELQEDVADSLLTTKVQGKASRVVRTPTGFRIASEPRLVSIFDFPQKRGEFALKAHETNPESPPSPYFINFRNLPQELLDQFGALLNEIQYNPRPDFCTGIPTAGVDIAKAYAKASGVPYREDIFIKEEYDDGKRRIVAAPNAPLGKLAKLLIIDDLVTEAGTKDEAWTVAKEVLGYDPVAVAVILDREQGGREKLAARGIKLEAAFSITSLLEYYHLTNQLSDKRYERIQRYRAATR